MIFTRFAEDHVMLYLKDDALCILVVLGFTRGARTTVKSKEAHCGSEARYVGATWRVGNKGLEIEVKSTVAGSAVKDTAQSSRIV